MGVDKMETRAKLWEGRVALRELKEKVEALLKKREYAKVVEEIETFCRGYTPGERDVEWAELQVRLAFAQEQLGRYDTEIAEGAYEVLKHTDRHKEIGTIEWIVGKMHLALGETKIALRYLRNALSQFDRLEDERRKAQVLNTLGQGYFLSGRTKEAIRHLTEAIELCKRKAIDDRWLRAMVKGNVGCCYIVTGQWPLASKMLRYSLKLYEGLNNSLEIARRATALCRLYILQRRWDGVSELLDRAQKLADAGDYQRERATVWESRGWWEIALAEREGGSHLEAAEQALMQALQIGYRIAPEGDVVMEASERLGWVCLMRGNLDGALSYGERSLRISKRLGSAYDEGLAHRLLGAVYQKRGEEREAKEERRKARDHFARSISLLGEAEAQYDLAVSFLYSGKILVEDGETRSEGFGQILQARKIFETLKVSYWLGRSWIEEARGRIQGRDFDKASQYLATAKEVLKGSGEKEALKEIVRLRAELDGIAAKVSLSVKEEINLLEELSQPSNSLDSLLKALMKKSSAERAIIGVRGSVGGFELKAYRAIDEAKARNLLDKIGSLNGDLLRPRIPIFSSLVPEDSRLISLKGEEMGSLMMVPLGMDEELDGLLYVDRLSNKPFQQKDLNFFVLSAGLIQLKVAELQKEELKKEVKGLRKRLEEKYGFGNIVTLNPKMEEALRTAQSFRDSRLPILIQGETGTGKELMAEAIHYTSQRRGKNFLAVNCAAFTDTLLESEFFGHKKGSFTNAITDEKGLFEEAQGGTLFLDEVANASGELQAKLLRVLEEMEVRKIGETKARKVEVSIISATNKNLERMVKAGKFRKDLYYRLTGVEIKLPPLRERKEDIPPLVYHFLGLSAQRRKDEVKGVTQEAMDLLTAYDWPGNVRELEHRIERAVTLADEGAMLTPDLIGLDVKQDASEGIDAESKILKERVGQLERAMIIAELAKQRWNKSKTAEALGLSRLGLRKKIARYNICERT